MTKHLPPEDPSAIDRAHAILPLITATHDAYAHKKSEKELIKQYRFMYRVFRNARLMLNGTDTDEEPRQILKAVGEACLDEHAE